MSFPAMTEEQLSAIVSSIGGAAVATGTPSPVVKAALLHVIGHIDRGTLDAIATAAREEGRRHAASLGKPEE